MTSEDTIVILEKHLKCIKSYNKHCLWDIAHSCKACENFTTDEEWMQAESNAIQVIKEQKVGKWVHGREIWREHIGDAIVGIGYEDWRCSECNTLVKEDAQKILWKYCPWCGAKMEGTEE